MRTARAQRVAGEEQPSAPSRPYLGDQRRGRPSSQHRHPHRGECHQHSSLAPAHRPRGRTPPMPERNARQGRPEKDRPCRRGIGGFRISLWMGQDRWFHVLGGERHQGDSRYRQGRAPRWPCGSVSGRATTPCARCPRRCWTAGRPAPALVPALGRCLAGSSPSRALRLRAAGPGSRRRPGPGHRPRGPGPRTPSHRALCPARIPSRPGTPDRDPPGPGWHPWRRWFPGRGRLRRSAAALAVTTGSRGPRRRRRCRRTRRRRGG